MNNSQMFDFLERLKGDKALQDKVKEAEHAAARHAAALKRDIDHASEANLAAIGRIAKEAGYDISLDVRRPAKRDVAPADRELENLFCLFTCCIMVTSVWDTEGAGGSGPF